MKYGRNNTFLLSVTDDLLQIALRVTEDDGPLQGDMHLLRVLIKEQTIIKPSKKRDEFLPAKRNAAQHKEKKLIKMIKMAVGIEFKKIKEEASKNEQSTLNDLSAAIMGEKNSEMSISLNETESGNENDQDLIAPLGPKEKYL